MSVSCRKNRQGQLSGPALLSPDVISLYLEIVHHQECSDRPNFLLESHDSNDDSNNGGSNWPVLGTHCGRGGTHTYVYGCMLNLLNDDHLRKYVIKDPFYS